MVCGYDMKIRSDAAPGKRLRSFGISEKMARRMLIGLDYSAAVGGCSNSCPIRIVSYLPPRVQLVVKHDGSMAESRLGVSLGRNLKTI